MTYLEYAKAHREERKIPPNIDLAKTYCPDAFAEDNQKCMVDANPQFTPEEQKETCRLCWNREMPGRLDPSKLECAPISGEKAREVLHFTNLKESTDTKPHILDSGNRRKFESGAVRDICEGKGRCDLLPLNVLGHMDDPVLTQIDIFQSCGLVSYLYEALEMTYGDALKIFPDKYTMLLEVSKHFEEGAKKYGDNNWRKGIPVHCYIDSAVRHYLKYRRGDKDEPHDRAFCWNLMCGIWTCLNKPELNEYKKDVSVDETTKQAED